MSYKEIKAMQTKMGIREKLISGKFILNNYGRLVPNPIYADVTNNVEEVKNNVEEVTNNVEEVTNNIEEVTNNVEEVTNE
jgi:methyl-accepting chemotaxis protein